MDTTDIAIRMYVAEAIRARKEQGLPPLVEDRATLTAIRDALEPRDHAA